MTPSKTTIFILAAAIFAAALCGSAGIARGQLNDPTGVWDMSITGTVIILAGIPLYYFFKSRK